MKEKHPRNSRRIFVFQRSISFFVLTAFIFTNHLSLHGYASTILPANVETRQFPKSVNSIQIPEQIGKIQEFYQGQGEKAVVLVQDAHAIPEAQRNIQKIIGYFQKQYGLNLIALEGASKELDPQIFRSFPDKEILTQVFNNYFDNGELTGSAAAAIFNDGASFYHGVENWPLYEEGLSFYLKALEKQEAASRKIEGFKEELQKQKVSVYSKKLLEFDGVLAAFRANHGNLIDLLKRLAETKAPEKGTQLAGLIEEINRAEKAPEVDQRPAALKALAKQKEIEGTQLFKDLENYIQGVKDILFKNDQEKRLDQQSRELELLEKLTRLELGYEDWAALKNLLTVHRVIASEAKQSRLGIASVAALPRNDEDGGERLQNLLKAGDQKYMPLVLKDLQYHLGFYRNAGKRDEVLFENLTSLMKEKKSNASLLVAGGFHTEGITQRLKEQGISYVLLTPKINSIPENSHYREHMTGKVSWMNYFRVENGKVNLYEAFVRAARDRLLGISRTSLVAGRPQNSTSGERRETSDPNLLKNWRDQIIKDLAQKGQITKAKEYLPLIDEVNEGKAEFRPKWQADVERFLQNLRHLEAKKQLTEQNVLKLLADTKTTSFGTQPAAFTELFNGPGGTLQRGQIPVNLIPALGGKIELSEQAQKALDAQFNEFEGTIAQIAGRSELRASENQPEDVFSLKVQAGEAEELPWKTTTSQTNSEWQEIPLSTDSETAGEIARFLDFGGMAGMLGEIKISKLIRVLDPKNLAKKPVYALQLEGSKGSYFFDLTGGQIDVFGYVAVTAFGSGMVFSMTPVTVSNAQISFEPNKGLVRIVFSRSEVRAGDFEQEVEQPYANFEKQVEEQMEQYLSSMPQILRDKAAVRQQWIPLWKNELRIQLGIQALMVVSGELNREIKILEGVKTIKGANDLKDVKEKIKILEQQGQEVTRLNNLNGVQLGVMSSMEEGQWDEIPQDKLQQVLERQQKAVAASKEAWVNYLVALEKAGTLMIQNGLQDQLFRSEVRTGVLEELANVKAELTRWTWRESEPVIQSRDPENPSEKRKISSQTRSLYSPDGELVALQTTYDPNISDPWADISESIKVINDPLYQQYQKLVERKNRLGVSRSEMRASEITKSTGRSMFVPRVDEVVTALKKRYGLSNTAINEIVEGKKEGEVFAVFTIPQVPNQVVLIVDQDKKRLRVFEIANGGAARIELSHLADRPIFTADMYRTPQGDLRLVVVTDVPKKWTEKGSPHVYLFSFDFKRKRLNSIPLGGKEYVIAGEKLEGFSVMTAPTATFYSVEDNQLGIFGLDNPSDTASRRYFALESGELIPRSEVRTVKQLVKQLENQGYRFHDNYSHSPGMQLAAMVNEGKKPKAEQALKGLETLLQNPNLNNDAFLDLTGALAGLRYSAEQETISRRVLNALMDFFRIHSPELIDRVGNYDGMTPYGNVRVDGTFENILLKRKEEKENHEKRRQETFHEFVRLGLDDHPHPETLSFVLKVLEAVRNRNYEFNGFIADEPLRQGSRKKMFEAISKHFTNDEQWARAILPFLEKNDGFRYYLAGLARAENKTAKDILAKYTKSNPRSEVRMKEGDIPNPFHKDFFLTIAQGEALLLKKWVKEKEYLFKITDVYPARSFDLEENGLRNSLVIKSDGDHLWVKQHFVTMGDWGKGVWQPFAEHKEDRFLMTANGEIFLLPNHPATKDPSDLKRFNAIPFMSSNQFEDLISGYAPFHPAVRKKLKQINQVVLNDFTVAHLKQLLSLRQIQIKTWRTLTAQSYEYLIPAGEFSYILRLTVEGTAASLLMPLNQEGAKILFALWRVPGEIENIPEDSKRGGHNLLEVNFNNTAAKKTALEILKILNQKAPRSEVRAGLTHEEVEAAKLLFNHLQAKSQNIPADHVLVVLGNPYPGYAASVVKLADQLHSPEIVILGKGKERVSERERIRREMLVIDPHLAGEIKGMDSKDESMHTGMNVTALAQIVKDGDVKSSNFVLTQIPTGMLLSQRIFEYQWRQNAEALGLELKEPVFYSQPVDLPVQLQEGRRLSDTERFYLEHAAGQIERLRTWPSQPTPPLTLKKGDLTPEILQAETTVRNALSRTQDDDIIKVTNPFGKRLWMTFEEGIKLLTRDLPKGEEFFLNVDMNHAADITGSTVMSDGSRILIKSNNGNYQALVQQGEEKIQTLGGQFTLSGSATSMKPEEIATEKFFWIDSSVNHLRLIEPGHHSKKDLEEAKQEMQQVSAADISIRSEVRAGIVFPPPAVDADFSSIHVTEPGMFRAAFDYWWEGSSGWYENQENHFTKILDSNFKEFEGNFDPKILLRSKEEIAAETAEKEKADEEKLDRGEAVILSGDDNNYGYRNLSYALYLIRKGIIENQETSAIAQKIGPHLKKAGEQLRAHWVPDFAYPDQGEVAVGAGTHEAIEYLADHAEALVEVLTRKYKEWRGLVRNEIERRLRAGEYIPIPKDAEWPEGKALTAAQLKALLPALGTKPDEKLFLTDAQIEQVLKTLTFDRTALQVARTAVNRGQFEARTAIFDIFYDPQKPLLQAFFIRSHRSEVRAQALQEAADHVVSFFRGGAPSLRSEARQIVEAGIDRLVPPVEAAIAKYEAQDALQSQQGFASIKGISQLTVIRSEMRKAEIDAMSSDALKKFINTIMGSVRANKFIAVRLQIPAAYERRIRDLLLFERRNKKDPVKTIPAGNDLMIYNEGLPKNISLTDAKPALVIRPNIQNGSLPQLDPSEYANQGGPVSPENRAEVFTAGLLWVSDPLSKQTAEVISKDSHNSLYHLSSPAVLGPLSQIGGWLASRAVASAA